MPMRHLPYILTGIFMTATALQTVYIHDTNVMLDAKDARIARLTDNVSYWQEASINN